MSDNRTILGALALDLHRVSLGYQRGSIKMAEVFLKEARKRKSEIRTDEVKPYVRKLLSKLDDLFLEQDHQKIAEDALMYSTLFQNAALQL